MTSATAGFAPMGTFEAAKGARKEFQLAPAGTVAQWLKLEVASNWGHAEYTELMELEAYGEPEGEPTAAPPIAGVYQTNYNLLLLRQRGSAVVGCYDWSDGTLMGSTDGRVVQFEWREDQGTDVGTAIMVLSSAGDYLNGLWYRQGVRQGVWKGPRAASGTKPRCTVREAGGIGAALAESGRAIVYGIYFDSGSARLRAESEGALTEVLGLLKAQSGLRLLVEGHTDSTDSDAYNLKLSAERAQAVRDWLVAREIATARLEPKGLGESRPVADNTTPQGRALNRRVEIVVLK
jgi:outer membrane protein OmpA-like peptidoglycan-associated protein